MQLRAPRSVLRINVLYLSALQSIDKIIYDSELSGESIRTRFVEEMHEGLYRFVDQPCSKPQHREARDPVTAVWCSTLSLERPSGLRTVLLIQRIPFTNMRYGRAILPVLLASLSLGAVGTATSTFSPFEAALEPLLAIQPNRTAKAELVRRQSSTSCPTGYDSCSNLGAPQLCCGSNAVCSADYAGDVACCPSGAACTGTIGSVITAGTISSGGGGAVASTGSTTGGVVTASATTTTDSSGGQSTNSNGLVVASVTGTAADGSSATSTGGFVVDGSSTVATLGSGAQRSVRPVSLQRCNTSKQVAQCC